MAHRLNLVSLQNSLRSSVARGSGEAHLPFCAADSVLHAWYLQLAELTRCWSKILRVFVGLGTWLGIGGTAGHQRVLGSNGGQQQAAGPIEPH